ncbi:Conserved oligomeric Golgi complex subunit 2 [Blyttiomyces sp. JEL0837]|nr:Conserved oligomeric Golgi complex subunit 2 [Blyttiomyces sp. JEL0837]
MLVSEEEFADETFTAERFMSERLHIPLNTIRYNLNTVLSDVKAELVDLINRDYADFINISSSLVGLDKMISVISVPLDRVKQDVLSVKSSVGQVIDDLERKLEKRSQLREKKACVISLMFLLNACSIMLQTQLSVHESIMKLESLLDISRKDSMIETSFHETQDDGKLIERVAIEFNQLQFLLSRCMDLPYVVTVEWRILRIKDTITQTLSQALKASFKAVAAHPEDSQAVAQLTQFLRTYVMIDKVTEAGSVFRTALVEPFVSKTVKADSLEMNSGSNSPLREMYGKVLKFIDSNCAKILAVSATVFRSSHFDLLIDVIWVEVTVAITKNLFMIYNPGLPDPFHENFVITSGFISDIERRLRSRKSVERFRNHPSLIDFMKKWNLAAYFQIRCKETVQRFEDALTEQWDVKITDQKYGEY